MLQKPELSASEYDAVDFSRNVIEQGNRPKQLGEVLSEF